MQHSFINLLLFKTQANLRTEVSKYYLNYLWWIIEPVLMMTVFYVVFGIFLNRGTDHYVAFLLVGLTVWNWFARSVQHSCLSIFHGRGLMMQVNLPKSFFPLEVFLRDAFKHLFVSALLLFFLFAYSTPVSIAWLAFPVLLVIQAVLILGVGALCAAVVPFLPDVTFIVSTGIQLLFFGSGIFFKIEDVVLPQHQFIMYLNPMAGLIKAYRDILIHAQWPDWAYLGWVFFFSCCLLVFAFGLIRKFDHIYPRVCNQ